MNPETCKRKIKGVKGGGMWVGGGDLKKRIMGRATRLMP